MLTPAQFNQRCIAELEAAGFAKRIVVIGSGPSCPYITPLRILLEKLELECGVHRQPDEYYWDFCERAHNENIVAYYKVIEDCYDENASPHWDARAYAHLLTIRFKSYITFNYDGQLPTRFRAQNADNYAQLFSVYPSRAGFQVAQPGDLGGHKPRLVAIHGYSDRENADWPRQVILKTSDFNLHYVGSATCRFLYNWWKNLLAAHPCVFIGTSLMEPGLHRVVDDLLKDNNTAFEQLDHIHLIDFDRLGDPPHYRPPGRTLRAFRQIPYDKIDSRFSGLLQILSHFSGIPTNNPSPGMPAPNAIVPGDKYDFLL